MKTTQSLTLIAAALLSLSACDQLAAMHGGGGHGGGGHGLHGGNGAPNNAAMSLQDDASWRMDPHIKELHVATVAAFANGPDKVDAVAFGAASREIFDRFARARGMDVAGMQDHLKDIPGQIISIATEDPKVLTDFDAFIVALFGPE